MADGKIYITISDTRGGSGAGVSNDTDNKEQKQQTLDQLIKHNFFNFLDSQAKQAINYSIGNIGNFTGNYQAQRNAEQQLAAVNFLINLGSAIYTGFKTGGGPGAAIAAAVTIGSQTINMAYSYRSESFENKKINRNIDMMRKRLGIEGLTDGSRTGVF